MSKPVEFSKFFQALYAKKENKQNSESTLLSIMEDYKKGKDSESFLEEIGMNFCHIGITQLYEYSGSQNLESICLIKKKEWDQISDEKGIELPMHLANKMISYAKEKEYIKAMSEKWEVPKREIEKHVKSMARFITEGIIELID